MYNNLILRGIKHFLREYQEEHPARTAHFAGHCHACVQPRVHFHERSINVPVLIVFLVFLSPSDKLLSMDKIKAVVYQRV